MAFRMVPNPRGQWQALCFCRDESGLLSIMSIYASDSLPWLSGFMRERAADYDVIRWRRA